MVPAMVCPTQKLTSSQTVTRTHQMWMRFDP